MKTFAYSINDNPEKPDAETGFVQATNHGEALEKLSDPRANVYELPHSIDEGAVLVRRLS